MVDDLKTDTAKTMLTWLAGQPFNNVLMIMMLVSGGWMAHYTLTVAVPAHLRQIQDGYKQIEESHSKDRQLIIQQYDKWFDHFQYKAKGDPTGKTDPGHKIEELWRSADETNYRQLGSVVGANEIAFTRDEPTLEVTTPGGTSFTVSLDGESHWSRLYSGRSEFGEVSSGGRDRNASRGIRRTGGFEMPFRPDINRTIY